MNCRSCNATLRHTFLDLGFAPPSNAYLGRDELSRPEQYYPLRVKVCDSCWLVQTEDYAEAGELFSSDYAYFSSTSSSWLAHAKKYTTEMTRRLNLDAESLVVEIASNDGYLLKNFISAGISCLGIEPTLGTALAAEELGIPVIREFFGESLAHKLAGEGVQAELIIGNNVYAHVPDINDFTRGMKIILKPGGTITLEFPHLKKLIEHGQFDTVYHEHFSYLSLFTVTRIFEAAGLCIHDLDLLVTHGGSLRVYGSHAEDQRQVSPKVAEMLSEERNFGLQGLEIYQGFQARANDIKDDLLSFLIENKRRGKLVVGYGAAAKGNTLLNYAGLKPDLLPFICDAAESKQGKFMPGSHIPIVSPEVLVDARPDYVLILPWNIASEIVKAHSLLAAAGTRFLSAVPGLTIL